MASCLKVFFICRWMSKYPLVFFLGFVFLQLGVITATITLTLLDYETFPVDFRTVPLRLHHHYSNRRTLAWRGRNADESLTPRYVRDFYARFPLWVRGRFGDLVFLYYEANDNNILKKESLEEIKEIEAKLFNLPIYQEQLCQWTKAGDCIPFISIMRYFDGTFNKTNSLLFDPNLTNVERTLRAVTNDSELNDQFKLALDLKADMNNLKAKACRSVVQFGWPLQQKYTGLDKWKYLRNYIETTFRDQLLQVQNNKSINIKMTYFNDDMYYKDIENQAYDDAKLCIGSLLFIIFVMLFHTKSIWITFWAIFSLCSCFLVTNLIYRYIFGYVYFGFLHILSIFIILGIGADDIFVYYDTWRQSEGKLAERLTTCYRRAAAAMFVTSLTTTLAFLVSFFSPLFLIKSFGLFCGLLIITNYISVITFFPTVVLVYETRLKSCCKCCNGCTGCHCRNEKYELENVGEATIATVAKEDKCGSSLSKDIRAFTPDEAVEKNVENIVPGNVSSIGQHKDTALDALANIEAPGSQRLISRKLCLPKHPLRLFLHGPFYRMITHSKVSTLVIIFFFAMTGVFAYFCTRIELDEEQIAIFRRDSNYGHSIRHHIYNFPAVDQSTNMSIYIIWGLKEADVSHCNFYNISEIKNCKANISYDETFDINNEEVQLGLSELCRVLQNRTFIDENQLEISIGRNNEGNVDCFIDDMMKYIKSQEAKLQSFRPDLNINLSLPFSGSKIRKMMKSFPLIYTKELPQNFSNWFEIGLSFWLTNSWQMIYTKDFGTYYSLLGESKLADSIEVLFRQYYGTKLRYVAIRVNTTLQYSTVPYTTGLPLLERYEKLISDLNSKMPESGNKAFIATPDYDVYQSMLIQKTLVDQSVYGIAAGLGVAFIVLLLTSRSILLGLQSSICIVMATTCVVGMIPIIGWKLGALVSLNLCLVVGLSVDYIIHMAAAYHLSQSGDGVNTENDEHSLKTEMEQNKFTDISIKTQYEIEEMKRTCTRKANIRKSRTKETLSHAGVPVLFGAITTLGASVFMLFAQIQFYLHFGLFLFATVGFSLLFGMIFFPALVSKVGPKKMCW